MLGCWGLGVQGVRVFGFIYGLVESSACSGLIGTKANTLPMRSLPSQTTETEQRVSKEPPYAPNPKV